jgi:hypothetical protein
MSEATVEAHVAHEPNAARSGLIGYAIGLVVTCAVITAGGTLGGLGFVTSLGLGAFVGIWGGGGFGFMLGAIIPLAREDDARHRRITAPRAR